MTRRKTDISIKAKKDALPTTYLQVLETLKTRIRQSRMKAASAANRHLIELYWHIGKVIVERQRNEGWGKSVVERLAVDLHQAFPDMGGLSPRNIWRMRAFHLAYTEDAQKLPRPVAEIDGKNLPQTETVFSAWKGGRRRTAMCLQRSISRVLTIKAILMPCTACTKTTGIISGYAPIGISSILTNVNTDTKAGILRYAGSELEGRTWAVPL